MKIKTDFVTNSSSTSFILHGSLSTEFRGDLDLDKIVDINDEYRKVENQKQQYDSITEFRIVENDVPLGGDSEIHEVSTNVQIITTDVFDENDNEVKEHVILMDSDYDAIWDSKDQKPELYMAHLLKEIMKVLNYDKEVNVSYNQYIKEYSGDGWLGGDPQGKYTLPSEAILHESKVGTIKVSKDINKDDMILVTEWTKGR